MLGHNLRRHLPQPGSRCHGVDGVAPTRPLTTALARPSSSASRRGSTSWKRGVDLRSGLQQPGAAAAPEAAAAPDAPQPTVAAAPKKGSVIGAVSLITGSTVGAGMLALPAVSAPAGIIPTSFGLTAIWGLLTLDALLIAEVNLAALAARNSRSGSSGTATGAGAGSEAGSGSSDGGIVTLRQMAEFSLGKAGKGLTLVYLALAYSLLTAYCTKAAEVLDYFAGGQLPPLAGAALFCGAIGGLLYKEGTRTIDSINQGLTSVLLALFAVILTAGAAQSALPSALQAGVAGLASLGPCDWSALEPAVPIMFLALVYHDLVPVIVAYLGGDRRKIRSAIILGSLVPLTMFLSWEAVSLSLLPAGLSESASGSIGGPGVLQASLQLAGDHATGAAAVVPAVAAGGSAGMPIAAVPASLAVDGPSLSVASAALPIAVDPLQVFVRRSGPLVGSIVEGFSFLAVMTSFIGTTLSLSETLRTEVPPLLHEASKVVRRTAGADVSADLSDDELACLDDSGFTDGAGCSATWVVSAEAAVGAGESAGAEEGRPSGGLEGDQRALALLLTLCPPLAMAAANPDSFLGALEIAGGYFMTLLFGILPPLMAWKLREKLQGKAAAAAAAASVGAAAVATAGDGAPQSAASPAVQQLQQQWQSLQLSGPPPSDPQQQQQPWWVQQHEEMVPGGLPLLAGMFSVACAIELSRLAADTGMTGSHGNAVLQSAIEAALQSPGMASEAVMALLQAIPQ